MKFVVRLVSMEEERIICYLYLYGTKGALRKYIEGLE